MWHVCVVQQRSILAVSATRRMEQETRQIKLCGWVQVLHLCFGQIPRSKVVALIMAVGFGCNYCFFLENAKPLSRISLTPESWRNPPTWWGPYEQNHFRHHPRCAPAYRVDEGEIIFGKVLLPWKMWFL